MSWWLLARPRLAPFVVALPAAGAAWAHWDHALPWTQASATLRVCAAWLVLHVGTMWWNAAFDRDEGPVLLGASAPVPSWMGVAGMGLLLLAVPLAWVSPFVGAVAAVAAGLSWLYSHPRWAWKAHPVAGPGVNLVGYGICSPLAGWASVGVAATPRGGLALAAIVLGVGAAYFAAQAFQGDEDRRRGYRTLVATRGPSAVIGAVRGCTALCCGALAFGAVAGVFPRTLLVMAPLALWLDGGLSAWQRRARHASATDAQQFAMRLGAAAVVALLAVGAAYVRADRRGEPVAGLNTARGWPVARPRLPPAMLRVGHGEGDPVHSPSPSE